jgi:hypothetical protein
MMGAQVSSVVADETWESTNLNGARSNTDLYLDQERKKAALLGECRFFIFA